MMRTEDIDRLVDRPSVLQQQLVPRGDLHPYEQFRVNDMVLTCRFIGLREDVNRFTSFTLIRKDELDRQHDVEAKFKRTTNQLEEARAALRVTLDHYSLFVGPDDAIANAVKQQANDALPEHREQQS